MLFYRPEAKIKKRAKKTARYFRKHGALVNGEWSDGMMFCFFHPWSSSSIMYIWDLLDDHVISIDCGIATADSLKYKNEFLSMLEYFNEIYPHMHFSLKESSSALEDDSEPKWLYINAESHTFVEKEERYEVKCYDRAQEMDAVLRIVYKKLLPLILLSKSDSDEQSQSLENSL